MDNNNDLPQDDTKEESKLNEEPEVTEVKDEPKEAA